MPSKFFAIDFDRWIIARTRKKIREEEARPRPDEILLRERRTNIRAAEERLALEAAEERLAAERPNSLTPTRSSPAAALQRQSNPNSAELALAVINAARKRDGKEPLARLPYTVPPATRQSQSNANPNEFALAVINAGRKRDGQEPLARLPNGRA
jgi:hypothetical protein